MSKLGERVRLLERRGGKPQFYGPVMANRDGTYTWNGERLTAEQLEEQRAGRAVIILPAVEVVADDEAN